MGLDDQIRELADGAYRAALDDGRWPDWAWQATRLLGGACGALYVIEPSGRLRKQIILHDDLKAVERYMDEHIYRFDPQIGHASSLRSSRVYADTDHLDRDCPDTREYLSWQAANGKLGHYATAAAVLNGGTHLAGLSVHRAINDGPTPDLSRRILDSLLPDVQRALELGFVHAEKTKAAYWDGLLSNRAEPCLLLADDGRVLRATAAMEQLLATGDGLGYERGRLSCVNNADGGRLDAFLRALSAGSPVASACRVARRSGKKAYVVTGYPMPRSASLLGPFPAAAALVTVIDPAAVPRAAPEIWRAAYGFTSREAELAALLVAGHSVETAAATLSISGKTARVHLRHLFAKTATSRQAELVLLLPRISDSSSGAYGA